MTSFCNLEATSKYLPFAPYHAEWMTSPVERFVSNEFWLPDETGRPDASGLRASRAAALVRIIREAIMCITDEAAITAIKTTNTMNGQFTLISPPFIHR